MNHHWIIITLVAWSFFSADTLAQSQKLQSRMDGLRITDGPFSFGYRLQASDGRLNWYFNNLGLLPLSEECPKAVRSYLDLYLKNTRMDSCTIEDVRDLTSGTRQPPDSDDSYAATMLSLAARYRATSGDQAWWEANRVRLKQIGRKILLNSQKPNGLVTVFADDKGRTTSYLMDNCEAYRGLIDFADVLAKDADADAIEFSQAASRVANGVAGLFDEKIGAFRVADVEAGTKFYPLRTAQVFPEVFGVPLGDGIQTRRRYDSAWNFMNATGDRWEFGKVKDGSLGGYPWMILGYAAAIRGEDDLARIQLKNFKKELKSPVVSPAYTAIHELGWAIRTQKVLNLH